MQSKKTVRSRLVFNGEFTLNGKNTLDVTATYNMTKRDYMDRNQDMEVETENGERLLIVKRLITAIREVKVVEQVAQEVRE